MGGLVVRANVPAPRYEFEMLSKGNAKGDRPVLFLHYKVRAARCAQTKETCNILCGAWCVIRQSVLRTSIFLNFFLCFGLHVEQCADLVALTFASDNIWSRFEILVRYQMSSD